MNNTNRIGGLLLLVFAAAYLWFATQIPLLPFQRNAAFTAQTMPIFLGIGTIILSLVLIVRPGEGELPDMSGFQWGKAAALVLVMTGYGFFVKSLGFIISTSAFLFLGFFILGERRFLIMLAVSIPIAVFFWLLMTQVLDVYIRPLPDWEALGLGGAQQAVETGEQQNTEGSSND